MTNPTTNPTVPPKSKGKKGRSFEEAIPEIEQAGKDGDYDKALSEFQRLKKADIAKAAAVFYKTNPDLRDAFRGDEGHPFVTKMTKQQMLDKLESDFDKYNGDDAAREANGELDVEPVQPTEPATSPATGMGDEAKAILSIRLMFSKVCFPDSAIAFAI